MTEEHPAFSLGMFDSGVGGLSVWREVALQLPAENVLYLADQAHVPYGPRLMDEIVGFAQAITCFLLDHGCQVIAIVCNAASAAALHTLRQQFPQVAFVGMEPAVKPAAENTHTHKVGVLATPVTFQGKLFASQVERFGADIKLFKQVCPGLVEQVEAGRLDTPDTHAMLQRYLAPMLKAGVDTIVLGCTHYPFLLPIIQSIAGPGVRVIDPSPAVAKQIRRLLAQQGLLAPPGQPGQIRFYTTGDAPAFSKALERLTGTSGQEVRTARWSGGRLLQFGEAELPSSSFQG
ncbi:MAG: glutamate racemase [Thermoflexales bacterium]|nr:glutamate racemase [Thermoflexales bacterium]